MAEREPIEDVALAILRPALPGIQVVTAISKIQTLPAVLVRRLPTFIYAQTDPAERWLEQADLSVHSFAQDPDGDRDAAILAEAARIAMRDAWLSNFGNDNMGWICRFTCLAPARRVPDWATASGPVQYANLPNNFWRYEGRYRLTIRKPKNHPYPIS